MSRSLEWPAIKPLATRCFNIWEAGHELHWAEQAWAILAQASLTAYETKQEHHVVVLRLLVLKAIYEDFCDVAWGEYSAHEYYPDCIDSDDLDPSILLQMYGKLEQVEPKNEMDNDVIDALVEEHRCEVAETLTKPPHGDSVLFYESLWFSLYAPEAPERDEESPQYAAPFDDSHCAASEDGFDWVCRGCPRHRL